VQALAKRFQPLASHEIEPSNREHAVDRRLERDELEVGQLIDEALERDRAVVRCERLRSPHAGHRKPTYADVIPVDAHAASTPPPDNPRREPGSG
jgi:hypothetical protein